MTDEAKQTVKTLRNLAKHCKRFARDPYLAMAGIMTLSADMIEKLSADRDAWKRRCEAAERELKTLRPCHCCKYYRKELAESGEESDPVCGENCVIASKWEWRGPCAENGGETNDRTA